MRTRSNKIRSHRHYHRVERRYVVWNHSNWSKIDRIFRRIERHAGKRELEREVTEEG